MRKKVNIHVEKDFKTEYRILAKANVDYEHILRHTNLKFCFNVILHFSFLLRLEL